MAQTKNCRQTRQSPVMNIIIKMNKARIVHGSDHTISKSTAGGEDGGDTSVISIELYFFNQIYFCTKKEQHG